MEFGVISLCNLVIVAVMLVPNIIFAVRFPNRENKCDNKAMNLLEQVGRYGSMALMVLPLGVWEFGFSSVEEFLIWGLGSGGLLLAYLILWIFYFRKESRGLAMALAVIPTCIFLLSGITLRHWLLAAAAVIFGVAHIYVTRENNR